MTDGIEGVTAKLSRPKPSHTVSAGLVRGLVEFAIRNGAPSAELLAAAGLEPALPADDDIRIPFARHAALYRAAELLCDDPAISIHFGEWVEGMDLLVCHVGSVAETLGDALEMINRYNHLAVDLPTTHGGDPFLLERTAEGLWLVDATTYPDGEWRLTDTGFVRLIASSRLISKRQFVRRVHLMRGKPAHHKEYERIFAAPVRFGQDRSAMLMDPGWLALALPTTSRYAGAVLEAHAKGLMEGLGKHAPGRAVAEMVAERLDGGAASMPSVARALGMSRPGLYRALRAEGQTFEDITIRSRKERAYKLLADGRTIAQAAAQLGYSDRSAFSRAFKRWTGLSPSAVLRTMR